MVDAFVCRTRRSCARPIGHVVVGVLFDQVFSSVSEIAATTQFNGDLCLIAFTCHADGTSCEYD